MCELKLRPASCHRCRRNCGRQYSRTTPVDDIDTTCHTFPTTTQFSRRSESPTVPPTAALGGRCRSTKSHPKFHTQHRPASPVNSTKRVSINLTHAKPERVRERRSGSQIPNDADSQPHQLSLRALRGEFPRAVKPPHFVSTAALGLECCNSLLNCNRSIPAFTYGCEWKICHKSPVRAFSMHNSSGP